MELCSTEEEMRKAVCGGGDMKEHLGCLTICSAGLYSRLLAVAF